MAAGKTIPSKITRPGLSGVVQRERLFDLLDGELERPVVWVSSPAGSGKTTLISSYLDSRKLPFIWYQCDEGDSDLPTFFSYMGLAAKKAAPRDKNRLPLLTPEYLAGIPVFTRRYFEKLYGLLIKRYASRITQHGFFIVLDNYQDVPADSPFHDMIANGFAIIPDGVHIVVISRNDPPPALARMQANEKINLLEYSDIRFTFEESGELAHGRIPKLDNKFIKELHEKTEGWAAGIILMLARTNFKGAGSGNWEDFANERVFDYFAEEIFSKTEKGVQDFLLKTAFLPVLSIPLAGKLTGAGNAGQILPALSRNHYFTDRLSGSGQGYQYHPLFRAFLLNMAKSRFTPDKVAVIQREAAMLLEQSGEVEEAARLYGAAGDRQGLVRMVIDHARELLMQGRNKTVEEWIARVPAGPEDDNPWLSYWTGMCSFPVDMPRARKHFEKAFESFRAADDTAGIYLSWAAIADTCVFGLNEWKRLDDCIAVFEGLRRAYPSFPSKEIALIASSRMLISLTLRRTDQPARVHKWLERVSGLLQENPSVDIKMDTVFSMSVYYLWLGEYDRNALLLERAEAEIQYHQPSPFAVIRIKLMKGIHYWITAQYGPALAALSEGLEISDRSGVHVFDSLLWGFRAAAEMAPGNMELAEISLKNQMAALLNMANSLDVFFYHINSAWYALLKGNALLAAENMDTISAKVVKMGAPYYRALWNIGMAQVAFLQDRTREAKTHIHTAQRISLAMKSRVMEWYSLLIGAWFLLKEGREKEGLLRLRRGLSLGKRHGYVHLEFYQPSVMQFLFAKALEEGIEQEYVKGLIRKLGLTPPIVSDTSSLLPLDKRRMGRVVFVENWPYPVKIYTLGRFEVIRDDKPFVVAGKVQKKPLDLLKALIAFGGKDVPEEQLTDALWPEAEGDLAHKSLEMTLSRLRRLLGGENVIKHNAGQLSINPLYCWVDSLALEHISGKIRKSPADQLAPLCKKAAGLYKGHFLPSDANQEWAVSRREILKNSLLRIIITAGRHYEQEEQWENAVEYYMKGLDTDKLAEKFYQRLMICYQKLGNKADAARTFNCCRNLLHNNLGIEPSAETQAIYSSILQKQ